MNCRRVFEPKSKVLQVNYCLGLEVREATHYVRADTAALYNQWLDVRKCILADLLYDVLVQ